jgi:hypothetical protein
MKYHSPLHSNSSWTQPEAQGNNPGAGKALKAEDVFPGTLINFGHKLSVADIRAFLDAGVPFMSEAGFEALKKQLRGEK